MIRFLDVAAPTDLPQQTTNPILVIGILVVLIAVIIILGVKLKEK